MSFNAMMSTPPQFGSVVVNYETQPVRRNLLSEFNLAASSPSSFPNTFESLVTPPATPLNQPIVPRHITSVVRAPAKLCLEREYASSSINRSHPIFGLIGCE